MFRLCRDILDWSFDKVKPRNKVRFYVSKNISCNEQCLVFEVKNWSQKIVHYKNINNLW